MAKILSFLSVMMIAVMTSMALPNLAKAEQTFDAWLEALREEALTKGISSTTLDEALTGIKPIPRVIELDRKQPEFTLTFQEYLDRVVPTSRKKRAQARLATHQVYRLKLVINMAFSLGLLLPFGGLKLILVA